MKNILKGWRPFLSAALILFVGWVLFCPAAEPGCCVAAFSDWTKF